MYDGICKESIIKINGKSLEPPRTKVGGGSKL